ncbi:MAG: thioredoxin domain-containing protein [Emcibacter sp.]|nr:thioredoxin domain-containing protein [Emcibacter sp.]
MTSITVQSAEDEFSSSQKKQINQMIRAYILEHPEILPEAIQILHNRSKKATLEQNHTRLYEDGFSYVGGNKNGDVTVIEFFDYNCGYCKRAMNTVEKLKREDGNIRVIYKEFPILSETSYTAAKAAMASMNQGKYEEYHTALLHNSGRLTEERIFEIAREVGLDEEKLAKDMTSPVLERNIKINHSLAQALEITATPVFVIGDTILPGAVPYSELLKMVKNARQQAVKKAN